jgi:hypothetical protein
MPSTVIHAPRLPNTAQEAMMNASEVIDIIAKRHGAGVDVYPSVVEKEGAAPLIALNFKISGLNDAPVAKIIREFVSSDTNLKGSYIAPKEAKIALPSTTHADKVKGSGSTLIQMDLVKLSALEPHQFEATAQKAKTFRSVGNNSSKSL